MKRIKLTKKQTVKAHPLARVARIVLTQCPEIGPDGKSLAEPYVRLLVSRGAYVGDDWHQTDQVGDQEDISKLSAADKVEVTRFVNNIVEIFAKRDALKGTLEEES